jgi:hypothetical protein
MSIEEQYAVKKTYHTEAVRYMNNAKDFLKIAKKEDQYYHDPKYVRIACGTAYSGLLIALEGFLILKDVKPNGKTRKTIEFYQENIGKIDRKMLDNLNSAYQILHLFGYYDGVRDATVVKRGFDVANLLIDKIKPKLD